MISCIASGRKYKKSNFFQSGFSKKKFFSFCLEIFRAQVRSHTKTAMLDEDSAFECALALAGIAGTVGICVAVMIDLRERFFLSAVFCFFS